MSIQSQLKCLQNELKEIRKEMRTNKIRKISCFNGGLTTEERYYNNRLFALTTKIELIKG